MALAKGQDERAEQFLKNMPSDISLMIPCVCYLEAIVALQNEQARRKSFQQNINAEINETKRNVTSNLGFLVNDLEKSRLAYDQLLGEFENKFFDGITLVRTKATSIDIQLSSLEATLTEPILKEKKQLRDDLILQCIIEHAAQHPQVTKVLLSSNSQEFGKPEVRQILNQAGITKYFTNTTSFLGWLENNLIL